MASSWQLWLSPRPRVRTNTAVEPAAWAADDAVLNEFLQEDDGRHVVRETHYLQKDIVRKGLSGPPLHIHLRQKEYFQVEKGSLGVVKNEKEYVLTGADAPVSIEPGVRHRFWVHSSSKEDVVFKVWVEPQDMEYGFDESFVRNLSSYVRDCEREKIAPSIFQIILILYHSEIVITPPFWLPIWLLVGIHHVLAYWIGAGLLGYQASYPEYSNETYARSSKARKSA